MLPLFVGPGVYGDPIVDADGEARVKFSMSWRFPRADDFPDLPHACPRSTGASVRETMSALLKLQGIPVDASNPLMAVPPVMSFLGEFDTVCHPGQLIMDGIKRCRHGGRLLVRPGTYTEDVELAADKSIHLFGQSQVTIAGSVTSRSSTSSVDGFTLQRLVVISGRLLVNRCQVTCSDERSPAVRVLRAGQPLFRKCVFQGCAGGALRAELGGPLLAQQRGGASSSSGGGARRGSFTAGKEKLGLEECVFSECGGDAAVQLSVRAEDSDVSFEMTASSIQDCKGTGLAVHGHGPGMLLDLRGVSVRGCAGAGLALEVRGAGAAISVAGCDVSDCGLDGVLVDCYREGCRVDLFESAVSRCGGSGIRVLGEMTEVTLKGCRVTACGTVGEAAQGEEEAAGSSPGPGESEAGAAPGGAAAVAAPPPQPGLARAPRQSPWMSTVTPAAVAVKPTSAETRRTAGIDLSCLASFAIDGCTVSHCLTAVRVESLEAGELANCEVSACQYGLMAMVYFAVRVVGNSFTGCTAAGISLAAGLDNPAEITGNTIAGNEGAGMLVWRGASAAGVADNTMEGNEGGDVVLQVT